MPTVPMDKMQFHSWIFSCIAIMFIVKIRTTSSYVTLSPKNFENKLQKILDFHNTFRSCHRVPALILDRQLTMQAQQTVELLMQEKNNSKSVKTQKNYGENLFTLDESLPLSDLLSESTALTRSFNPVITWYDEFQSYNGGNPNSAEHFTQLVWKNTRKLGCGMAQNKISTTYILCYYYPTGNLAGEYDKNVLPVKQEDTDAGCMYADFTTPYGNMKTQNKQKATTTDKMAMQKDPEDSSTDDDEELKSSTKTPIFSTTTGEFSSVSTEFPPPKISHDESHIDKKDFLHWLLILMTFVMILLSILLLAITAYLFYKMCKCCISRQNKNLAPRCSPDVQLPVAIANPPTKNCPNLSPGSAYGKSTSPRSPVSSPKSPASSRPSTPQNVTGQSKSRY